MKTHGHGYYPDLELSDRSQERLEMKTHGHGYHADLELSDRSRGWLEVWIPLWKLHWVLLRWQGLGI